MENELEIGPASRHWEILDKSEVTIDNGAACVEVNLSQTRIDLQMCDIEKEVADKMMIKLQKFIEDVEEEKKKGIHLGSTDLGAAIYSVFFSENPEDLGFKTETERNLAAKIFEKNCIEKEEPEVLEIG